MPKTEKIKPFKMQTYFKRTKGSKKTFFSEITVKNLQEFTNIAAVHRAHLHAEYPDCEVTCIKV